MPICTKNTATNYSILHGLSGFDEVSLTDEVKIISNTSEQILKPIDFKLPECKLETIKGGTTVDESAKNFLRCHFWKRNNGSKQCCLR